MAFMRNINDFILTLVALSLPSIAATIDCNGKPFHCLNSTHFMICVDFGSGVSSTMDDFVIPCPPTTVCQATNRFECEFPTVTTTTVTPVVTNSPLVATVNNDVVIDTVSDVTTIPFEEYFNTISTTTLSEGNLITRDAVTTELPINNPSESFNVPATGSIINETAINVAVSPTSFTTLATLDIVTDQTTVTELIPNVAENVNVIFEPNSNISEALPTATEMVRTDIDFINLSENNTVDVTENYESNSTLLETIIGATNFRQFNTPLYNSTSYNVTKPIVSEATESIITIPIDDKQVYLTTLDASPDVVLDSRTIENLTESIPTKPAEYNDVIQHQSNSTLNETMSIGDIVQNDLTTLNTALDINGFAINVNHSGTSFNETTTKYEEQMGTAEPILFEGKGNSMNIPVDEQVYLPMLHLSPDVSLDDQTIDDATESIPAETTEYKRLIEPQSNRVNNKPLENSTSYDITEPILSDGTESLTIPVDEKHPYLSTLDASPYVVLADQTLNNVTETVLSVTTDYKNLIESQSNSTLNKTMSGGDIVQIDTTKLNTVLKTDEYATNVNNSDSYFSEMTTKYKELVSTAEPILYQAKENTINILVDDKQAYLTTLDASPDVSLDNQTIGTTESIPAETTEYKLLIEAQSNSTLYETISGGDIVQNDTTKLDTVLNTNESALNVNNSDSYFNEITTKYEEQISTAEPILNEAMENELEDKQAFLMTLENTPDVFLDNKTIDRNRDVTVSIPTETTEYKLLIEAQSNSTLYETMSGGDIVQNDTTKLDTVLNTNESALNVNNSDSYFNEITTKYEEQISTAEPILIEAMENELEDKQAFLTTLENTPDVFLDNKTIDRNRDVTESIPTETTEYKLLIEAQSNSTLYETISGGDIVQNDTTKLDTVLNTNESALNVNNSDSYFNEITSKYEEQISTAEPILNEAMENELEDKQAFLTTLENTPDVFLDNKTIDRNRDVTESVPTETTEHIHSIESQSNSTLNATVTMSSGDIEQIYTTTADTILNTNGSVFNVHNSNLSLNEDTTTYNEEQISTAQNNFELSGNTGTEITQPDVTEMANSTKLKLSVSTIATTTVNTELISTNTPNAAINTDATEEVTFKLNVIESENQTNIFDDMQTAESSFKNHRYLKSTADSVTSTSDNRSVIPDDNTNTKQSEIKEAESKTEEIHLVLPKPPRSNETITTVYGDHYSADITSTTYPSTNIDTIIAKNKITLNDISAMTNEAQRVLTSEVIVNDKTADATENINNLLNPVTEPMSTPLSSNAHDGLGSDLSNENLQEMSTFINKIELTARGNVTNETLTQNVSGGDMINSTEITVTPSNHIELSNRVSVSTVDDQINTVVISESTPNDILETSTQEADSFNYSDLYYQTDIEKIRHDKGVLKHNILSADTIESTSSILVLTTESSKDAVLQATTSFNNVSDNYPTSTTNSPQPEATASTVFNSRNSAVDTSKLVTRSNEVEEISTASKLEITSTLNENSYVATEHNIPTTELTNSPQLTAILSSAAFVNTNSAVNQVKQVTRQVADEKNSTEPSMLPISFTINKTAYVATEKNIPSVEVTPEPTDLILERFKYTTTTESANSVRQESRLTITSDSSTTKPSDSSALSAQSNREIKETLLAIKTSNTATDSSGILNLTVSNLRGVSNFGEEINGITVVDSLTTETTVDAISKASTDNVLEKYPITVEKEDISPEDNRNSIKTNTTTEENIEPLRRYSIQRENISKLEITSAITDQTTLASFIADDVNYTANRSKLADTHNRVLSKAQAEPNTPERFGANAYDPNSSINKAIFIDGLTSINTAVAADTKLTRDETNQQSSKKLVSLKISTTETLLNEILKEKDIMPVMPELKTDSESIVRTPKSNGDINTNLIITTETSNFDLHSERLLSFTTSIQESKYQSNLVSSTESWQATVVAEPVVHPTRPYTETLITSSKPYTESNDQISQEVTSVIPKLNLAYPSKKQYINLPKNIEPATKNVLTSLEPSVIFPQVTEPSGVANQDVESSSVRKSTTQKSYGIDTLKLVPNQRLSSTENPFINVTPLTSPSTITKPVDLSSRQSFTAPDMQILSEHHVLKNGEQIKVSTTEKLKVNVIPVISPSIKDDKPLVDATAVPILKYTNNISKNVMLNDKSHLITAVYNSNRTVEPVPKTEFNKVQLNITSTTEKTMIQSSDLDIVMVDIVNTDLPNLGEIAISSNNTHSGISAVQKSTSQQVEKHKAIKSVAEDKHQTEKTEKPETGKAEKPKTEKAEKPETEEEEKPEVAETNPLNSKIEHLTSSTESIPINKQANAQHNPPLNIKQQPVQNATTRTRPVDSHVKITTARYHTKTKSSVANTHNSTHPASETSKQNFVCKSNSRGRFSDNGDCRKFYICIGKHEPIKGICPNNTVFSELRKQCTKNLSHCVRNNQFQCVSEGRFSDYLNDNIYYICVNNKANRFIRFKLQCQNGYHLNKTSVRCVMNTESILSSSQQSQQSASEVSTSNQSISAKSEKIKEKPKTNKTFKCKRSGKFPEPNDCRKYYVCTKLGKSEYRQRSKKCDSDEVYNRDKKKCDDADSYECS